ncbi:MAG TPA: GAF domain-containing sensor histidine kinase [Chloroflexia bacterium]|nr:GAF domain-containing sensor histidine kinase [Chloroflexia bacterium]
MSIPTSTFESSVRCPALADLMEGYREEIVAAWVRLLYSMDDSHYLDRHWTHYRERPVTELQSAARNCVLGLVALFRTGDHERLAEYTEQMCEVQVGQGFDIAEVIEGHLLLKDAALPVIERESGWDLGDEASVKMLSALDAALRWLVIRFSKLYSMTLNSRLQEQVELLDKQRTLLERRVREITALVHSGALLTSTLDLDRLLSLILEQLEEVVEYDRASVQMLIEGRLRIIAGRGFMRPDEVLGLSFDPRENVLTRRMLDDGAPIILSDVANEPGFVADPGDPTRAWIGVPLVARGEVIGALTLDKKEPNFYDEADGATVLAFANQAAIAIENARLYDRAREQDILAERNRLARELHDSLSQSLFSMVLNAEAANHFFDTDSPRARAQIAILYETANAALKDMRSLIFELRPANLENEGLATVLTKHAKMIGERYGIKIRTHIAGQRRLSLPIEKALFRVAQEALNNVVKHANATEVTITLSNNENWVTMSIEDNGTGIAPGAIKPNTLGLTSMRERVEQLSGTIEFTSGPGGVGTIVKVKVPCDR